MATTQKWSRGTADTILTTELNSLANNTNVIKSTAVQPTSTEYTMVEVELYVSRRSFWCKINNKSTKND